VNIDSRKKSLRFLFQRIIDPLGYKFSPDADIVDFLLEQEVILEQKHGIPYCPCQGLTKNREERMKIVCPCIPFHREYFDAMKRCWCGLYVHKDVTNPGLLKQIPVAEIERGSHVR
jgi:ferredoxin-thioredoxin reductase catalytic chain